jgi:ligand-binding sensor domain-containing protein
MINWLRSICLASAAWAGCVHGVRAEPPASPLNVAALVTDGERLFIGTFDGGVLERSVDGGLHNLDSTLTTDVNALVIDPTAHGLWVGTTRGLVRCALSPALQCVRLAAGGAIHALLLLRDGRLLAGGDAGLLVVSRDGETRRLDKKRGAPFRAVWALAEADDGTVFVGATNGLYYGLLDSLFDDPTGCARVGMITGGLPDDWVTALAIEQTTLHVGLYHAGLVSFGWGSGKLVPERADPTLGYVNPGGLRVLADGRLAVATMEGLRIGTPGAYRTLYTPERDVTALVPSGPGRYWVGTRAGIVALVLAPLAR